jgi:non-homologous end joining protein Ku
MKKIDDRTREELEKIIFKKAESKDDSTHSIKSPKRNKNITEFM